MSTTTAATEIEYDGSFFSSYSTTLSYLYSFIYVMQQPAYATYKFIYNQMCELRG